MRAACNNLEMAMMDGDTTQGAFRKSHPAINAMNLSHTFGDHFFLPISYQLYFARNCLFVFPLNRGKIHFYKSQNADFCQSIHSALEAWKEESKSKIYVSTKLFLWFNAAGNHKLLNLLGMPQSTLQSTSLYMVTKTMRTQGDGCKLWAALVIAQLSCCSCHHCTCNEWMRVQPLSPLGSLGADIPRVCSWTLRAQPALRTAGLPCTGSNPSLKSWLLQMLGILFQCPGASMRAYSIINE